MSVLAIVSKAIFEKQPVRQVGAVWPTDAYVSTNANLQALKDGGSLYLVTVRPGDQLWLVAVLVNPAFDGKAWRAKANAVPIADVTTLVSKLKFTSGKGITTEAGKLGMSLQTPRALTEDDVALLEAALGTSPKAAAGAPEDAYASVLATTPKAQAALALGADLAAHAKERGLTPLRFDHHRRYATWIAASAADKALLDEFSGELEAAEEFDGFEVVDVIDELTGKVVYAFALWPFGSGALIDVGTKEAIADVIQHWFNAHEVNPQLRESMAVAYHHAHQKLGLAQHVDFTPGQAETHPQPKVAEKGTLLEQLAAMRAAVAADIAAGRAPDQQAAWGLIPKLIPVPRKDYRPFPVRRPWELTPVERETLDLVVDLGAQASYFVGLGLPERPDELARFIGRAPATPLDEAIEIDGKRHPAWCLVLDAVYEERSIADVVELLSALPSDRLAALWTALLETYAHHLRDPVPRNRAEQSKDSPLYKREILQRYVDFLVELNMRLGSNGEDGRRLAKAFAENSADWMKSAEANLANYSAVDLQDVFPFVVALACLTRWAKKDGTVLDVAYDPLLAMTVRTQMYLHLFPTLVAILEQLPVERAQTAAGDAVHFVERFPSAAGAERVIRYVETATWLYGPYYEKILTSLFKKVGEPARALLEASLAREHPRHDFIKQLLAKLGKGKKK